MDLADAAQRMHHLVARTQIAVQHPAAWREHRRVERQGLARTGRAEEKAVAARITVLDPELLLAALVLPEIENAARLAVAAAAGRYRAVIGAPVDLRHLEWEPELLAAGPEIVERRRGDDAGVEVREDREHRGRHARDQRHRLRRQQDVAGFLPSRPDRPADGGGIGFLMGCGQ
ncbi:hypothetical protein [Palleronia sp.]|uniref:hypothetical protein n=1 Tax=Palleronia sp. TaxID=1940284 RepID=UPI0035C821BA